MDAVLKELIEWLKQQEQKELQGADNCDCFDEVNRAYAYEWCANSYKHTIQKIEELRKKNRIRSNISMLTQERSVQIIRQLLQKAQEAEVCRGYYDCDDYTYYADCLTNEELQELGMPPLEEDLEL